VRKIFWNVEEGVGDGTKIAEVAFWGFGHTFALARCFRVCFVWLTTRLRLRALVFGARAIAKRAAPLPVLGLAARSARPWAIRTTLRRLTLSCTMHAYVFAFDGDGFLLWCDHRPQFTCRGEHPAVAHGMEARVWHRRCEARQERQGIKVDRDGAV
jgi:hypothetical protein